MTNISTSISIDYNMQSVVYSNISETVRLNDVRYMDEDIPKRHKISPRRDLESEGALYDGRKKITVVIPDNPFPEIKVEAYPPSNFAWFIPKKIAAMAVPRNKENLQFLVNEGITQLVTLSEERQPPKDECTDLRYTTIPVTEYQLPSLEQIEKFIELCKKADQNDDVIGVHCRQGRSRCSVMLACYLIHFHHLTSDQAIRAVKRMRKGSLDTEDHEAIVKQYFEKLQKDNSIKFETSEDEVNQLIEAAKIEDDPNL